MGQLDGKIAIVTGGGIGIGRAAVIAFAREGAKVAVANRTPATGEATVQLATEAGGEAIFVPTDISRSGDVQHLVQTTVNTFGGLDILFNNAGIPQQTSLSPRMPKSTPRAFRIFAMAFVTV